MCRNKIKSKLKIYSLYFFSLLILCLFVNSMTINIIDNKDIVKIKNFFNETFNSFTHRNNQDKFIKVEEIVKKNIANSDATFGVVVIDLNTNQKYALNENEEFESASLYKLMIMYVLFKMESEGKINLQSPHDQTNLKQMITMSSNDDAIYLVDKYTSWTEITQVLLSEGLIDTHLDRDVIITTPSDIAKLLELILNSKTVSEKEKSEMFTLLSEQKINDRIPVLLPVNAIVAHKTGELNDVRHDVGIVIGPKSKFILVLMTKGAKNPDSVKPIMSQISLELYNFFES